jgi:hypothetical protein
MKFKMHRFLELVRQNEIVMNSRLIRVKKMNAPVEKRIYPQRLARQVNKRKSIELFDLLNL